MRKNWIFLLVFVLVLGLLAGVSFAEDGRYGKSKGQYGNYEKKGGSRALMMLKNKDELGLSDEQVEKIKTLKISAKKESIKKNAEIEIIDLDITAEMSKDNFDLEKMNTLIDQKYDLKKAKAKSSIADSAALKDVLTEKQKIKLKELYKECKTGKKKTQR